MAPKAQLDFVVPQDDGNAVLARLNAKDGRQIPVMEKNRAMGIVCRGDIMYTLQLRTELGIWKGENP